jgi:hypothetical protein
MSHHLSGSVGKLKSYNLTTRSQLPPSPPVSSASTQIKDPRDRANGPGA